MDVSNVPIFCDISTISCLSNPITGRNTGMVHTSLVAARDCSVWDATWPMLSPVIRPMAPFCPAMVWQGAHDNNTPSALVQAYYDAIEAPDKELIWFEHSAHGPLREEPETYKLSLIHI